MASSVRRCVVAGSGGLPCSTASFTPGSNPGDEKSTHVTPPLGRSSMSDASAATPACDAGAGVLVEALVELLVEPAGVWRRRPPR